MNVHKLGQTWKKALIGLVMLAVLLVSIAGCSSINSSSKESQTASELGKAGSAVPQAADTSYGSNEASKVKQSNVAERKVSDNWKFKIEVQDSRQANSAINQEVERLQGYLANSSIMVQEDRIQASLTLKVPANKAPEMISFLEKSGKVLEQSKASTDVSDEYYDTDARLKVMVKEEERLLNLLETRAATIQDLLAVEKEIARVRGEREALQARMNRLNNMVDYTTFAVSLEENKAALQAPKGTLGKAGQGFVSSLNQLVKLLNGLFIVLITILPFLIVLLIIAYPINKLISRRRSRKKAPKAGNGPDIKLSPDITVAVPEKAAEPEAREEGRPE
ncbi:MAG: DUF4349 domain-containing protein [Syntrophomonadaceae bacterium]